VARVRPFRFYDARFFLDKEIKYYCLSNRIRFTTNQFSMVNCFLDALNPVAGSCLAVTFGSHLAYYWGGQAAFDNKNATGWFNWLAAGKNASNSNLLELIEFLTAQAGQEGMRQCAVVLDESHWVTGSFRQNGFGVYAKQSVWQFTGPFPSDLPEDWQSVTPTPFDEYDRFYESQITPLIRRLGSNWRQNTLYALKKDGMILATAKASASAPCSRVYLEPIFHPAVDNPANLLFSLAKKLCSAGQQEINVLIPGFQAWVADSLRDEGFAPVSRQILFVKNLAVTAAEEKKLLPIEHSKLQPAGPASIQLNQRENEPLRK